MNRENVDKLKDELNNSYKLLKIKRMKITDLFARLKLIMKMPGKKEGFTIIKIYKYIEFFDHFPVICLSITTIYIFLLHFHFIYLNIYLNTFF